MTRRKRRGWLVFNDELAQAVMDKFLAEEPASPDDEIVVELQALNPSQDRPPATPRNQSAYGMAVKIILSVRPSIHAF